jgi:hypothetical protein
MQNLKKVLVVLTVIMIGLTSFTMIPKKAATTPEKVTAVTNAINAAKADGKITNAELNNIASIAKGEKLSLKDRIALKIFGKKIGTKLLAATSDDEGGKSQLIALILCWVVGGLGIHRFYLGYTWQGIVQLLTLGGCGVWTLIDFVRIITGSLQPKDGSYAKTL